jgi:hypothetical protein
MTSSTTRSSTSAAANPELAALAEAVGRRRNFAIISHPDAGKTTLTEKLLLYGGAIQQAGAVKAKGEQRKVTSDWMELEKQRGISITCCSSTIRAAPSTCWTPPATRTSPKTPTAPWRPPITR